MSKTKKSTIEVQGTAITILSEQDDYISLTDIARYRDSERTDYIIQNWLRNRNTIEFLGVWEQLNNPGFNPIEFDGIRIQTGLNSLVSGIPTGFGRAAQGCEERATLGDRQLKNTTP